jgi:hypothetical protein
MAFRNRPEQEADREIKVLPHIPLFREAKNN